MQRAARWSVLFSVVGLLAAIGLFAKVPLLVLEPGPAPDVGRRIQIAAPTFDSQGSIHLTTAQIRSPQGTPIKDVLFAIFDSSKTALPREAIFPSGQSPELTKSVQAAQMTWSELEAVVAALSELEIPYEPAGVFVLTINSDSRAVGALVPGDVITAINSKPVPLLRDLEHELSAHSAGARVQLEVVREGENLSLSLATAQPAPAGANAVLRADLAQFNQPPFEVSISSRDIGGPSAGLMFALSVYDRLVPEDLTRGRKIAGTGTIDNQGNQSGVVGEVGSVGLKVRGAQRIGASVFLVPKQELAQARMAAGSGINVIGVATLKEAIEELRKLSPASVVG